MHKKNVDTYLSIINDTLNSLQEDYIYIYESASRKECPKVDDRESLIEEIKDLKNKINYLESINSETKRFKKDEKLEISKKINETEISNKIDETKIANIKEEGFCNKFYEEIKKENLKYLDLLRDYENKYQILLTEKNEYKEMAKRFKNEIMDLKGSVRVFLRIKNSKNNSCIEISNNSMKIFYNKKFQNFLYDKIFDVSDKQEDVFKELENLVESVFEGYNICLFVYGQTGSGKTYTMLGTINTPGIIYRSLDQIFKIKKEYEDDKFICNISCTCVEIYNEEIFNLFNKKCINSNINNLDEGYEIINNILKLRKTESTSCNSQSSRSHLIFTLHIEIRNDQEIKKGSLCFIDLAGSERLNQSKVEGIRLKETQNINKSLSSLGDVFTAILRKESHIPYRNSKLTFYLQEYLSGNSRVAMILNINGDNEFINETVSTLRFGSKVSECKLGKAEKNVIKKLN